MSAYRRDLPLIPLGGWRAQAACPERMSEMLWDDQVEGESEAQRRERHRQAKAICNNVCPVREQCSEAVDWRIDDGVRGGHVLPPLWSTHSMREAEMARLLRKGLPLDLAARAS